ncbi:MAG: O-antigen ligase family protein [Terracidiphilus sp.]
MNGEIAISGVSGYERQQIRGVAFALGFFFSFRLAIVLISVNVFGLDPSTGSSLSLGLDLLLLCLVCFDSIGSAGKKGTPILRPATVRWVLAYLAVSALSLIWSETASLTNSIAYWFGLAIDTASVALLLRTGDETNEAYSIMTGFIWSTCILALAAWIMPAQPDLRLGDEQFFNTNEIGNLCAIAIFFAQFLARRDQGSWRLAKLLLIFTLVRSLSKSTLLAFVMAECFLLVLDRSMSRKTKLLLLSCAFVLILAFWGLFEAYYDVYTTAGNQAETITGRTAIWLYVLNAAFDHPWTVWIGHGFDSWWRVVPPFGNEMFEARHAENEMLQQFYAYGVTGVVLLAGIYGSLAWQSRRLARSPVKIQLACMLVFIVVRGIAVADSFDLLLPMWAIVMLSLVIEQVRSEQAVASPIPTNATFQSRLLRGISPPLHIDQ